MDGNSYLSKMSFLYFSGGFSRTSSLSNGVRNLALWQCIHDSPSQKDHHPVIMFETWDIKHYELFIIYKFTNGNFFTNSGYS